MATSPDARSPRAVETYRFGSFLLEPERRSLHRDGHAITLSARAFDLLCLLVRRRETVLSKEELRATVWRGLAVDDNNLAVQVSALRRALGETQGGPHLILTVPGQGYQFVAEINHAATTQAAPESVAPGPAAALPVMPAGRSPARRVRASLLAAACVCVIAWLSLRYPWRPARAPRLSIAVLPFRDLGTDPAEMYLADAISDDLTTDLSHIPGSTVIARASADIFRNRTQAADAIGRVLRVRYLLEGSIRAEADTLHVNAQLIDAPTGTHLWAQAFDVPRKKLGEARTGIVRTIASALNFTLTEVEAARSLHERPDNPDAVDYFLRARSVLERGTTLETMTQAQGLLEHATGAAPQWSDALALLGLTLARKIEEFDDPAETKDYARAQAVVARALALSPENPTAITAKGYLSWVDGKCAQARASFQLALSLDSDDLTARNGLAVCARELSHMQEMIDQLRIMMRIDPASPANARRLYLVGVGTLMLNQPTEAVSWLEQAGAGLPSADAPSPSLGWEEWRLIFLMAATAAAGDVAGAGTQYAAYRTNHPNRTVWRLAAYEKPGQAALPGHAAYLAGLKAAGMPAFAREDEDFGLPPATAAREGEDFDPTPLAVAGATRVETAVLHDRLVHGDIPLVIDVGHGAATIPGSQWIWSGAFADQSQLVAIAASKAARDRPVVVMGDGPTGWSSINAALQLVALGFHSVLWYRGGEEAWRAASYAATDRRAF